MMDRSRTWAAVGAVGALLVLAGVARAVAGGWDYDDKFTVALWGDTPYSAAEVTKIPTLIADINAAHVAFSVFDGDIKSGSSVCSDDVYTTAIQRFNTFGQRKLHLTHQAGYVENTRWIYGPVVFLGLNIPGSNNNKVDVGPNGDCVGTVTGANACLSSKSARTCADCIADNGEYAARDAANIQWLHDSFTLAKSRHLRGLMVIIQADMWFDLPETETVNERLTPGFEGYNNTLAALVSEAQAFDGQVVLVHGDTHFFKLDKPLVDQAHLVSNLTRLETFGSPNVHWVKVTVDPYSRNLFRFEPMIVPGN